MRILFWDMEFANGQAAGSIYSIGILLTDGKFKPLKPGRDILINPECRFNDYVKRKILAYPMEQVRSAPKFPAYYKELCRLFGKADLVVGFAIGNDIRMLAQDCRRYGLENIPFAWLDMEMVCKATGEKTEAHGLGNCVEAWCGKQPENQHRSDGDALATMLLMQGICRAKGVTAEGLREMFPQCYGVNAGYAGKKSWFSPISAYLRKRKKKRAEAARRKQKEKEKKEKQYTVQIRY